MTNEPAYAPVQRCGFFFNRHQYGKWEIVEQSEITRKLPWHNEPSAWKTLIVQRRQCQKCGYYEYDKQEVLV